MGYTDILQTAIIAISVVAISLSTWLAMKIYSKGGVHGE